MNDRRYDKAARRIIFFGVCAYYTALVMIVVGSICDMPTTITQGSAVVLLVASAAACIVAGYYDDKQRRQDNE